MEKKNFIILLTGTVIAVFLGSFCASMVIFGHSNHRFSHQMPFFARHMAQPIMPPEFERAMEQNEKIIKQQEEFFDKIDDQLDEDSDMRPMPPFGHNMRHASFVYMSNAGVQTQETKDFYKIIVDLKPFNNDSKNVEVKVKGNILTVEAKYKKKDKNDYTSAQVYQSLMLPEKIDVKMIKKQQQGDSLVITVPKVTVAK